MPYIKFLCCAFLLSMALPSAQADTITVGVTAGQSRANVPADYSGAAATDANTLFTISKGTALDGAETRTVFEFQASGIAGGVPVGATIQSAILRVVSDLSANLASQIALHFYQGNGSVESTDFLQIHGAPVLFNVPETTGSNVEMLIDVTSIYQQGTYSGFRINQEDNVRTVNLVGLLGGVNAPSLTVNFTAAAAVPEPGVVIPLLLAMVFGGCWQLRRKAQAVQI